MKKVLFLSGLLFLLTNAFFAFYFDLSEKTFSLIHAASSLEAQNTSTVRAAAPAKAEPLVSVAVANKPVAKQQNLKTLYPNLTVSGSLTPARLKLIEKVLFSLPADKLQTLKSLKVLNLDNSKRGVGGANTIVINAYKLSDSEFISVLTHELGHVIDLGGISGSPMSEKSIFNDGPNPIYLNDLSVAYYNYSWNDSYSRKSNTERFDFVSGYAMSDPFEDFAESFTFYTLHNLDFQVLAEKNLNLRQKYNWIRDNIYGGKELNTGSRDVNPDKRVWDITKIAIAI